VVFLKIRIEASGTSGITEQGQYDVLVTETSNDKYYLLEGNASVTRGLALNDSCCSIFGKHG
jgi:hypothetical protein